MNKQLLNFFLKNLKRQTEKSARKSMPGIDIGAFQEMIFLASKDGVTERIKFERFEGDKKLSDSEVSNIEKILSININNELSGKGKNESKKECDYVRAEISILKNEIKISWYHKDKTFNYLIL